jgi:hypothetical protein
MNVAVGRLHLSISMAPPLDEALTLEPVQGDTRLEQSFRLEQNHRAAEADRDRWVNAHPLRSRTF